jgi:dienelactone hydrolase
MKVLLLSDIFGQHLYLDNFTSSLTHSELITIVDPYQTQRFNFTDENHAYQTFITQCGHDNYAEKILNKLNSFVNEETIIIAFSAGAAATWRAIANLPIEKQTNIKHFIGFYPSQIRHHLNLHLNCPTTLFFPHQENHFLVDNVINTLQQKPLTNCIKTTYLHGFMNPQSVNFNPQAQLRYIKEIVKLFAELIA